MRTRSLFSFVLLGTASLACSSSSGTPDTTVDSGTPKKDTGTGLADHFVAPHVDAPKEKDTGVVTTKDAGDHDVTEEDAKKKTDAVVADAASDVGVDGGQAPTPVGTALSLGQAAIQGITDDGYVIYSTATAMMAIPVASVGDAGAAATTLFTFDSSGNTTFAQVIHNDVFIWADVDASTYIGTLSVWSHTLGTPKQLSTTSSAFVAGASSDSSSIVYASGTSADGSSATLYGANVASLMSPSSLVAGVDVTGLCGPTIDFSGTASPFYAVIGSCAPATTDGGADGPEAVAAYPTTTWTAAPLASGATNLWVDTKGTSAAIALAAGQLEIAPLAGGAPVLIDSATALSSTPSLYLSASDAFVLYATSTGALKTSTLTGTPAPMTLFATGAMDIDAVSPPPGEGYALVDTGFDMNSGLVIGLSLASTSTAGVPAALVTGTAEAGLMGDAFTTDGKYALFTVNVSPDDNGLNVGALTAVAVATPATPVMVAAMTGSTLQGGALPVSVLSGGSVSNTVLPYFPYGGSLTDLALTGSQIVYVDNFDSDGGETGQVDLHVIDLSMAGSGTTVMKSADPTYAVSSDKKYIVYTITFGGSTDGLYAVAVP